MRWCPGYVWGEPVRLAFAARGCSLAVALHADDVHEGGPTPRLLHRWDEATDRWARVVH